MYEIGVCVVALRFGVFGAGVGVWGMEGSEGEGGGVFFGGGGFRLWDVRIAGVGF